jgi:hypothetical protein
MSGGVAFVYDPFERFEQNCNLELVDLYAVEEAEDEALVHGLIKEHLERTGSTVASAILGDWFEAKQKFVKVYPRDYKRVLDAQKAAAANAAEAKALEAEDAFAKLVSMSSLADEAEKTNNALPLKVRPTRTETPKKLRGFVDYEREPLGYRDPNERLKDWNEVHRHDGAEATKSLLATQSARCMDCGTPFCHQTNTGGARWGTRSPSGTSSCTKVAGGTRWIGCTKPTTSPNSPAGSARRRARGRAPWASSRTRWRSRASSAPSWTAGSRRAGSCPRRPPRARARR